MKVKFVKFLALGLIALSSVTSTGCFHNHQYSSQVYAPTQTQNGYTKYTCNCGTSYTDNYTCLLSFNSVDQSNQSNSNLPILESQVVSLNDNFYGLNTSTDYEIIDYRYYLTENDYISIYPGTNIDNSLNISVVWREKQIATATDIAFDDLLLKIQLLEDISAQYNLEYKSNKNTQLRTMQYIRQNRYNSLPWTYLAGNIESTFNQYVANNQGANDLSLLQTYQNLIIPSTGEEVDFVHMISVMNVAARMGAKHTLNDLPGWLGDICQLAGQIKKEQLPLSSIAARCSELFAATQNSSFGFYDLMADLDAINIMQIYDNLEDKSISSIMNQYYQNINNTRRKKLFIDTIFNGETDKVTLTSQCLNRINNNSYIKIWCSTEGLDLSSSYDMKIINNLISLFLDYILI